MITIRRYKAEDAKDVGILIADTFLKYNLGQFAPSVQTALMGPFIHARSKDEVHRQAIADAIDAPIVLVAESRGTIVGVVRGGYGDRGGGRQDGHDPVDHRRAGGPERALRRGPVPGSGCRVCAGQH